jgi:hypothetical protein
MATTRRDLGSYRLGLVEDLPFIVFFAKRILTLKYGGWSWWKLADNFPVFESTYHLASPSHQKLEILM